MSQMAPKRVLDIQQIKTTEARGMEIAFARPDILLLVQQLAKRPN